MHESLTKETKWVCIQLACSRRPRAFEEAHCWNIQAKFYNEKFPLVYESEKTRDSLSWKLWCYFEAQVWKKRIVALSLFIFSFFGPSYFLFGLSLFLLGQCSMNDDHHTSIYLQLNDYNSILEQSMTLYECLRWCTGKGNESRVTCMINYAWWLCHKYDVNYMIMLSNMTMMNVSWWTKWWKVAWQYISEWLWKCHNR